MTTRPLATSAPRVRRVRADEREPAAPESWYLSVPAVAQVLSDAWELSPATVIVGENGAGKSTLVEAVALAFGLGSEGGSTGSRHATRTTESDLWRHLILERDPGAPRWGFFLRAETMHSFYTYLEDNPGSRFEPDFHQLSHGESFLALVVDRMREPGLYLLDEPESALSFSGCLALVAHLHALVAGCGAQVIVSTHSPVLASLPGADIWEAGEWGLRRSEWEDLDLVRSWRRFFDDPARFLHHAINPP